MNEVITQLSEVLDANQDLALIMAYLGDAHSSSNEPADLGRQLICHIVQQRLIDSSVILKDLMNQSGKKSS